MPTRARASWRSVPAGAAAASDADFVQSALDYLAKGGFVYSLEPQPLGQDTVDELLFVPARVSAGTTPRPSSI